MISLRPFAVVLAISTLANLRAVPSAAEPVAFLFGGTVTDFELDVSSPGPPPPWDSVAVGDLWFMRYTFESTTPDSGPLADVGAYPGAISSFLLTIGNAEASTAPTETHILVVNDVPPVVDQYLPTIPFDSFVWSMDLQDQEEGVALVSDDLPTDLNFQAFGLRSFRFEAADAGWAFTGDVSVFNIVAVPVPTISCPADVVLSCGAPSDPSATGTATGSSGAEITHTDFTEPSLCASSEDILRTWTATDAGGNTASCLQVINFVDTVPPVITCPPDVEVPCGLSADPASTGLATATDLEDPAPGVSFTDTSTPSECPASPHLERTWTAIDFSGNEASCVQTISFVDCGLSLFPAFLGFLDSLNTTPIFGDMTAPLRIVNEQRKRELITHAIAARALLESGERDGASDELSWIRERMDGELLGIFDWVKGRAGAVGRTQIDAIKGEIEKCGL